MNEEAQLSKENLLIRVKHDNEQLKKLTIDLEQQLKIENAKYTDLEDKMKFLNNKLTEKDKLIIDLKQKCSDLEDAMILTNESISQIRYDLPQLKEAQDDKFQELISEITFLLEDIQKKTGVVSKTK